MNESLILDKEAASDQDDQPLSQETIQALQELGEIYRQIFRRLISEGYVFKDGKMIPPAPKDHGATEWQPTIQRHKSW